VICYFITNQQICEVIKYMIIMKNNTLFIGILVAGMILSCGKKKTPDAGQPTQDTTVKEEVKNNSGPLKGTVTITQPIVEPGEEMVVNFTAESGLGNSAWIGIIPSNVEHGNEEKNDEFDIAYQYTGDRTSGSLSFIAPADTGSYDFRMNSSDGNGFEVSSVTFQVKGTPNTQSEIILDKKSYAKGEQMVIRFRAPVSWNENAWIGMVPASTKHGKANDADAVDVGYEYLKKRSKGSWKFSAPSESGKYSVRLFDAEDGKEAASVDFTVE
jgi:hypothetical protein